MIEFLSFLFSNVFLLLITFIACLFLLDFVKSRKNGSQFPPGPKGIPFLGNSLQVDFRNPAESLHQLRKEFGDIFSMQYFWTHTVVLNGFEVMKEALINRSEDIADRPRFPIYEKNQYIGDARGVIMARYGSSWKEQRRFTLSTLRDFGMGKKSLEERVTEEAQCLRSAFKSQKEQFNPNVPIYHAVSNVICYIAFGERFDYDDAKFQRLLHLHDAAFQAEFGLLAQILNEIPILVKIPWLIHRVMQPVHELIEFLKEIVSEHQKTLNPNDIRDFIDAYLLEIDKVKEDSSSSINEGNLLMTIYNLFSAGTETTSITLRLSLLYMILYPDVQSKVQKEIDEVLGRERTPTMGDVLQMPYTNAVIHEVQRCGDIAPLALPHMTYRDMEIKGYIIPKGTTIVTNLSSVLKDQQVWEKPFQFYPKHFLDENGKFVKREAFIPFSAGLVLAQYGRSWKEQRRFTLSTLRDFGMGKKSLEERVTEEAQCLRSAFKSQKDQFDPHFLVNNAVANVICAIAFGDRFDYEDAKFQRLLHLFEETLKAEFGLLAQIINEIPILVKIPWIIDHVMKAEYEIIEFLKEIVSEHKKTWNPNYTRDFIDAYLLEIEKVKEDSSSSINEGNLLMTTYDLFGAGTETTSTTMRWALLYMILYPDVQSKVQEEIDQVIGRERTPTMGDLLLMPYTNAVIHEVQRCGDIIPMALPHMAYRDMEIKGYIIPKGTTIITNLSSVLKDQQVWEKPFQFYPKHFLDENGKFVKREAFIPFSAGRRSCLGEKLARMELFLFFTTLLQQLTFEIPNNQPRPREDPLYALTLSPHPYNVRVVARV